MPEQGPPTVKRWLAGVRFGRLVMIQPASKKGREWKARCDCGCEVIVSRRFVEMGRTRSCANGACKQINRKRHSRLQGRLPVDEGENGIIQLRVPKNFTMAQVERAAIERAMQTHEGFREPTAEQLQIGVRTLTMKIKEHNIDRNLGRSIYRTRAEALRHRSQNAGDLELAVSREQQA